MIRLQCSTSTCPILDVNMYESDISVENACRYHFDDEIDEANRNGLLTEDEVDYWFAHAYDNFDVTLYVENVAELAVECLDEVLNSMFEGKITLVKDSAKIDSPPFYNYRGDRLDFDVDVDEEYIEYIKNHLTPEFFFWSKRKFGSHEGFISSMPYEKEAYIKAINGDDIDRAVAMWICWIFEETHTGREVEEIQEDFEDSVIFDQYAQLPKERKSTRSL